MVLSTRSARKRGLALTTAAFVAVITVGLLNAPAAFAGDEQELVTITCVEGEELVNDECVTLPPTVTITCVEGEELVNDECVTLPPTVTITCEEGEELVNDECTTPPTDCDVTAPNPLTVSWVRQYVDVVWTTNTGHFTASLRDGVKLCGTVTILVSGYKVPDTWDGNGFNPSAAPQQLIGTTKQIVIANDKRKGEATADLPTCGNAQADAYTPPELVVVTAAGHGGQYIAGFLWNLGECLPDKPDNDVTTNPVTTTSCESNTQTTITTTTEKPYVWNADSKSYVLDTDPANWIVTDDSPGVTVALTSDQIIEVCPENVITPAGPSYTESCTITSANTIHVVTEGITYTDVLTGNTVVTTAVAVAPFIIKDGAQTSWSHTFTGAAAAVCLVTDVLAFTGASGFVAWMLQNALTISIVVLFVMLGAIFMIIVSGRARRNQVVVN